MSHVANFFLSLAKSFAQSSNSSLDIVLKENEIKYKFTSKKSSDEKVSENHYKNAELYIEDSAIPVKLDWDNKKWKENHTVDVFEDFITTSYYKSFMKNESLKNMFQISQAQEDKLMTLIYGVIGGEIILGVLLMALYAA